jgi:hypothetical protein
MDSSKNEKHYLTDGQAGGRSSIMFEGDFCLKKMKPRERNFYQWLSTQKSGLFEEFRQFLPHFYGTQLRGEEEFLVLESLINGIESPNIIDIKLGKLTHSNSDSEQKVRNKLLRSQNTTSFDLGFRISGLIIRGSGGEIVEKINTGKVICMINKDNMYEYVKKIVMIDGVLQREAVEAFLYQTHRIKCWFEKNDQKMFRSTSILFINGRNGRRQTRLIDFDHMQEMEESRIDYNVLDGLCSLVNVWERILSEAEQIYE